MSSLPVYQSYDVNQAKTQYTELKSECKSRRIKSTLSKGAAAVAVGVGITALCILGAAIVAGVLGGIGFGIYKLMTVSPKLGTISLIGVGLLVFSVLGCLGKGLEGACKGGSGSNDIEEKEEERKLKNAFLEILRKIDTDAGKKEFFDLYADDFKEDRAQIILSLPPSIRSEYIQQNIDEKLPEIDRMIPNFAVSNFSDYLSKFDTNLESLINTLKYWSTDGVDVKEYFKAKIAQFDNSRSFILNNASVKAYLNSAPI